MEITFKKKEMEYLNPNNDDVLGVSMRMINTRLNRVTINSSINFLYFDDF